MEEEKRKKAMKIERDNMAITVNCRIICIESVTEFSKYGNNRVPKIVRYKLRYYISVPLLIGMQAGAATLENIMEVPQKVENRATL